MPDPSTGSSVIDLLADIGKVIVERVTGRKLTQEEARARAEAFMADPPRKTHLANEAELQAIRNRGDEPTQSNRPTPVPTGDDA